MTRQEFISRYGPAMSEACKGTNLFASVMIAQGIIETATRQKDGSYAPGTSKLFFVNNFFGIKDQEGDEWKGDNILVQTWEVINNKRVIMKDSFRVYRTASEGFADRIKFLMKNPRYTRHGVFRSKTPMDQAKALKAAGYATDPDYAPKLISIINKYNLTVFDVDTFEKPIV